MTMNEYSKRSSDYDTFKSEEMVHPGDSKLIEVEEDNLQPTSWETQPLKTLLKRTIIIGACLLFVGIVMIIIGVLTMLRHEDSLAWLEGFLVGSASFLSGLLALTLNILSKHFEKRRSFICHASCLILFGIASFMVGFCDCFFVIFKLVNAHHMFTSKVKSDFEPYDLRGHTMFLVLAIFHMIMIVLMMLLGILLMLTAARLRQEILDDRQKEQKGTTYHAFGSKI